MLPAIAITIIFTTLLLCCHCQYYFYHYIIVIVIDDLVLLVEYGHNDHYQYCDLICRVCVYKAGGDVVGIMSGTKLWNQQHANSAIGPTT